MALDSPASFEERVLEIGLGAHLAAFEAAKWKTFAHLAFAVPQGVSEAVFAEKVLVPGLGNADHEDASVLRRLFYESFMMASADLRRRTDPVSDDAIRKMPAAERRERFKRTETRLIGLKMVGQLEVSHRLIERCGELEASNAIKHIHLEHCTTRDDEVRGIEKDPTWSQYPDPESGTMRLKLLRDDLRNQVDSQFALNFSLQRRNIAMDMADVMSYENGELLRSEFIAAMMETPEDGYQPFSLENLMAADVTFWTLLARETRDGVRRQGRVERPCDKVFEKVLSSRKFQQAMTPRQVTASSRRAPPPQLAIENRGQLGKTKGQVKRENKAANKIKAAFASPPPQAAIKGKGAAKGKTKGATDKVKLPPGLMGMCARSSPQTGSKRMCFGFNLGSCSACAPGQECAKGAHLCMKPSAGGQACSKTHAASSCTGA